MKKINLNNNTIYSCKNGYLSDCADREDLENNVYHVVRGFTRRRLFRELITEHQKATGLEGYVFLSSHARSLRKPIAGVDWVFFDGEKIYDIQKWVSDHDGEKSAIILFCCNEYNRKITAEKSIVLHAKNKISMLHLLHATAPIALYMPSQGYLEEDRYKLRKTIDNLRGK